MPLEVIKIEDAMILGQATRYPEIAKKHVRRLSSSKLKTVAKFFVDGTMSPSAYKANQNLIDGLIEFSGGRKKIEQSKKKPGRVRLVDPSVDISAGA